MKLSEQTVEILKNYATLNQSLQIRKGSELTTITPTKTVFASTRVVESFPFDCVILDLPKLLSKLSLYRDCDLEFEESGLRIVSVDKRHADFIRHGSPRSAILPPADKKIHMPEPKHEFDISQDDLQWQRKSAGISGSQHMVFRGDGKKVYLQSTDMKNDSSDMSSTEIGTTTEKFKYVLMLENWKMLDGSYHVKLADKMAKFEHKDKPIEYYISTESMLSEG